MHACIFAITASIVWRLCRKLNTNQVAAKTGVGGGGERTYAVQKDFEEGSLP